MACCVLYCNSFVFYLPQKWLFPVFDDQWMRAFIISLCSLLNETLNSFCSTEPYSSTHTVYSIHHILLLWRPGYNASNRKHFDDGQIEWCCQEINSGQKKDTICILTCFLVFGKQIKFHLKSGDKVTSETRTNTWNVFECLTQPIRQLTHE